MRAKILRDFPWSPDGVSQRQAVKGESVDLPDHLVPGLEAEGYVATKGADREEKAVAAAPENKAETPPENKDDDLDALRAEYQEATGKKADKRWGAEALRAKIAEAAE